MLTNQEFVQESLITNLYYLRTLREYCARIEVSLPKKYETYINESQSLAKRCESLGKELLNISNNRIPDEALKSEIFITKYTLEAELLTEKLFDIDINTNLSEIEESLTPGNIEATPDIVNKITDINNNIINLANDFIKFANNLLEKITNQEVFAFYYNSLNTYFISEIEVYISEVERLNQRLTTDPSYITDREFYRNAFLYGIATFIRGEIDPIYQDTWNEANNFCIEYKNIIKEYENMKLTPETQENMTLNSLELARRFKTFLEKCLDKLLKKELYFISAPITKDNALCAVNYFIYNLEKTSTKTSL